MAQNTARYPVPETSGMLVRRTATGVAVGIVFVLLAQVIVDASGIDVGVTGSVSPFAPGPLIGATVVAGVGAALVYAAVVRFTAEPVRNFVAIAAVVFVLMLAPVLVVPPAGITATGQGILVGYHLLVAVPLVAFVVGRIGV